MVTVRAEKEQPSYFRLQIDSFHKYCCISNRMRYRHYSLRLVIECLICHLWVAHTPPLSRWANRSTHAPSIVRNNYQEKDGRVSLCYFYLFAFYQENGLFFETKEQGITSCAVHCIFLSVYDFGTHPFAAVGSIVIHIWPARFDTHKRWCLLPVQRIPLFFWVGATRFAECRPSCSIDTKTTSFSLCPCSATTSVTAFSAAIFSRPWNLSPSARFVVSAPPESNTTATSLKKIDEFLHRWRSFESGLFWTSIPPSAKVNCAICCSNDWDIIQICNTQYIFLVCFCFVDDAAIIRRFGQDRLIRIPAPSTTREYTVWH